jgi:hypothetical protein
VASTTDSVSGGVRTPPTRKQAPRSPETPDSPPSSPDGDIDVGDYEALADRYAAALARREELKNEDRRLDAEIANAYRQQVAIEAEIRAKTRPTQTIPQT